MSAHDRPKTIPRAGARAFSLVELLVVITIIAILLTISTVVGLRLVERQRVSVTQDVLRALDTALENYQASTRGQPPKYDPSYFDRVPGLDFRPGDMLNDINRPGTFAEYPPGSGVDHPCFPDASVFIRQARGVGTVDSVIQQIPERFLVVTIGDEIGQTPGPTDPGSDPTPSVIDAWGDKGAWQVPWAITEQRTILYVHPDNKLAQALYGKCVNNRPYFMSAGPDGGSGLSYQVAPRQGETATERRASVLASLNDNVYSYAVDPKTSADQTEQFFQNYRKRAPFMHAAK